MTGPAILLLGLAAMLAGVVLGYRSMPRRGVGPASAPRRLAYAFAAALLMILPWSALLVWFLLTVPGWPEAYGSTCRGRGCFVEQLWVSPGLLSGGWRELGLFLMLWFMPVLLAATLLWAAVTRNGAFARSDA